MLYKKYKKEFLAFLETLRVYNTSMIEAFFYLRIHNYSVTRLKHVLVDFQNL